MSEEKTFRGIVTRDNTPTFVANATVYLWVSDDGEEAPITEVHTDATGRFEFRAHVKPGKYVVSCKAFEQTAKGEIHVEAEADLYEVALDLALGMDLSFHHYRASTGEKSPALFATVGQAFVAIVDSQVNRGIRLYRWNDSKAARVIPIETNEAVFSFVEPGEHEIAVALVDGEEATTSVSKRFAVAEATSTVRISGRSGVDGDGRVGERVRVTMDRTEFPGTEDEALWKAIRVRSVSFPRYQRYIHHIFGVDKDFSQVGGFSRRLAELGARGVGVYRPLRDFTELFVLSECGSISEAEVFRDERLEHEFRPDREPSGRIAEELHRYLVHGELPYIDRVVKAAYPSLDAPRIGFDALRSSVFRHPLFLELWHEMSLEHGMLMRTMDAISARFQNIYSSGENDGLSNYESSPLRPLSDFFWGWIENEPLRLTARRRIQEYKHQYGPSALDGAALGVQAADVRTAFPDAFMNLMDLCEAFYREDNNTTVIADAFPVLFGLRQVHQILAMGAGNTAPQLTFAARVETLMMQLMLAQPELRAFLRVREMVPYDEAWQASVDAMIDLQGWRQPSISQHNDLAKFGERILLSIRLADWTVGGETNARNWLRDNREAVRRFMYAQRAIDGLDPVGTRGWQAPRPALATESRATIPGRRQRAYPELGFSAQLQQGVSQKPGEFVPRLPNRSWP